MRPRLRVSPLDTESTGTPAGRWGAACRSTDTAASEVTAFTTRSAPASAAPQLVRGKGRHRPRQAQAQPRMPASRAHRGHQAAVERGAPQRHRVPVVGGGHGEGASHVAGAEDGDVGHQATRRSAGIEGQPLREHGRVHRAARGVRRVAHQPPAPAPWPPPRRRARRRRGRRAARRPRARPRRPADRPAAHRARRRGSAATARSGRRRSPRPPRRAWRRARAAPPGSAAGTARRLRGRLDRDGRGRGRATARRRRRARPRPRAGCARPGDRAGAAGPPRPPAPPRLSASSASKGTPRREDAAEPLLRPRRTAWRPARDSGRSRRDAR